MFVTEGKGAVFSVSSKGITNALSFTEQEVLIVGEKLSKIIWYKYFREAQGGYSNEDILLQDNESSMLLEENGNMSVGMGSKHIHIRYFFVTDRAKHKEIKIKHCSTEDMVADFLSKPL